MSLRKILFWMHLVTGCVAGVVIFIISVTGVLLTYERQMIASADSVPITRQAGATRLPPESLLAKLRDSQHKLPDTLTIHSEADAPAEAGFGRDRTLMVDPYTGAVAGEASKKIRALFGSLREWHRWLGVNGPGRPSARAITGACNLAFFGIVVSGLFLWLPRKFSAQHLRPIIWFRRGYSGKARDFNWHNVIGIWCFAPLFVIVLSGVVMSYPWANNLVYTLTGSPLPTAPGRPEGRREQPAEPSLEGLNAAWVRAENQVPGWRAISVRIPDSAKAPWSFTIDQGNGGQPSHRSQLTLNRLTAETIRWETFSSFNAGRQLRSWLRFAHTGEAGGVVGQTIAGIASLGGAVLVWTGISLALRRLRAWRSRAQANEPAMAGR